MPTELSTLAAAWALFALCCISPIVWMLFGSAASGSLSAAATGFADERQRALMVNTLALGAGATILALAVGAPVGGRVAARRASLARLIFAVPLVLPSYVLGLA